ncbi:MAG: hypothetical protein ABEJ56_05165 [Candidatus Nanohaloarchaea archaeon]
MKGQAINIDWSIGFALFITTMLSSIIVLNSSDFLDQRQDIEDKVSEIEDNVIDEVTSTAVRTQVVSRTNSSIANIPLDREYYYRNLSSKNGTATNPSHFNFSDDRFATVFDTGNNSFNATYSSLNVSSNLSTDLSSNNSWINNSNISLKVENPGLTSMRIDGEELLNEEAEFSSSTSFRQTKVFHETTGGNLTVYNESREFILRADDPVFKTANFSTLYWYATDNRIDLNQNGTVKQGETQGFTVANSSLGITFTGNMTVNVSRPDNKTVKLDVESNRTRVMLHEKDSSFGEKRIENYADGDRYIQMERLIEATSESEAEDMENLTGSELENKLNAGSYGFNVTMNVENSTGSHRILSVGENVPLKSTAVETFTHNLLRDDGELEEVEGRVVIWE